MPTVRCVASRSRPVQLPAACRPVRPVHPLGTPVGGIVADQSLSAPPGSTDGSQAPRAPRRAAAGRRGERRGSRQAGRESDMFIYTSPGRGGGIRPGPESAAGRTARGYPAQLARSVRMVTAPPTVPRARAPSGVPPTATVTATATLPPTESAEVVIRQCNAAACQKPLSIRRDAAQHAHAH